MPTLKTHRNRRASLPACVLLHLAIRPGQTIKYTLLPDREVRLGVGPDLGSIDQFIGLLDGQTTKTASLDEIRDAAIDGWQETR